MVYHLVVVVVVNVLVVASFFLFSFSLSLLSSCLIVFHDLFLTGLPLPLSSFTNVQEWLISSIPCIKGPIEAQEWETAMGVLNTQLVNLINDARSSSLEVAKLFLQVHILMYIAKLLPMDYCKPKPVKKGKKRTEEDGAEWKQCTDFVCNNLLEFLDRCLRQNHSVQSLYISTTSTLSLQSSLVKYIEFSLPCHDGDADDMQLESDDDDPITPRTISITTSAGKVMKEDRTISPSQRQEFYSRPLDFPINFV